MLLSALTEVIVFGSQERLAFMGPQTPRHILRIRPPLPVHIVLQLAVRSSNYLVQRDPRLRETDPIIPLQREMKNGPAVAFLQPAKVVRELVEEVLTAP